MSKAWSDLTDKEIQTEIAINLSKIANILEMAFQPEIRQYMVERRNQEERERLETAVSNLKTELEESKK